jgi:hypothetical protein
MAAPGPAGPVEAHHLSPTTAAVATHFANQLRLGQWELARASLAVLRAHNPQLAAHLTTLFACNPLLSGW